MKKMVVMALCGWMLCGCSSVRSDANKVENGTRRMIDDVEDGFDNIGEDIQRGTNEVREGVDDTFDNHADGNATGYNQKNTKIVPSTNRDPKLINISSFNNATMGHPYWLNPITHL